MSMVRTAERCVESIFKTMAALVKDGTYKAYISTTHDSDYKGSHNYTSTAIRCLVLSFTRKELETIAGDLQVTDKKILIPLKGLSISPNLQGKIVIDATEYGIRNVEIDPTGTICTVQARI